MTIFSLRTLGGLALLRDGQVLQGASAQRKRLMLLALVAAHDRGRGITRDRALGLLWPDSDEARGRNALNQALFALRRELVADAIVGGADLRLDPALVDCDILRLWRAQAARDLEGVVAAYGGPFLDGVFITATPELDLWIEQTRTAVERAYRDALAGLARKADLEEDPGAVSLWQRLAAASPLDAAVARSLMSALARSGDRAGAVAHSRVYAAIVAAELGIEPDASVAALARELASQGDVVIPARASGPTIQPAAQPTAPPPAHTAPARAPEPAPVPRRSPRRSVAVAVAAVALLTAIMWSRGLILGRSHDDASAGRLVITPLETEPGAGDDSLRTVAMSLLASALTGAPGLQIVDPGAVVRYHPTVATSNDDAASLSRHFHAGRFLRGVLARQGRRLVLRATLHASDVPDSTLVTVEAEGSADSLLGVTDRLARDLLAEESAPSRRALARAAARSARSLDAFKAYLAGDEAMQRKQYELAVQEYEHAVSIDSSFAIAYYNLSIAADWAPTYLITRDAADRALNFSGSLGERERLLIAALQAWRHDELDEAEALYKRLTVNWRGDLDANYQLAEVLFHSNTMRCRSALEAEPALLRVLAIDPLNDEARLHLARIAAWAGNAAKADSLLQLLIAEVPAAQSLELRVFRAATTHDSTAFAHTLAELEDKDDAAIYVSCYRVAAWTRDLGAAEKLCGLLTFPKRTPPTRAAGRTFVALLAMASGERARARRLLAEVPEVGAPWSLAVHAWFETLEPLPVNASAAAQARSSLFNLDAVAAEAADDRFSWFNGGHVSQRHYYLALLARVLGDSSGEAHEARSIAEPLDVPLGNAKRGYFHSLSARRALDAGRMDDAIALTEVRYPLVGGDEFSRVSTRFIRAEALEAKGRRQEALDCYASFDGSYLSDLVLAAPAHLRRAAMFEREGATADARREYDIALSYWRHPDRELQRLWDAARRRRAALGA